MSVASHHGAWVSPAATPAFVDLAYRLLLGRAAEDEALRAAWDRLAVHPGSRRALIREIVASREFNEALAVEEALNDLAATVTRLDRGESVGSLATGERIVEVPWVLARCGPGRLLDVGSANGADTYLTALLRGPQHIVGVDLAPVRVLGMDGVTADACTLPFGDRCFSTVTCISTLEHIGANNSRYGVGDSPGTDRTALAELARVTAPQGVLLVTVPVGLPEDFGWFHQYSPEEWRRLVDEADLCVVDEHAFRLGDEGWRRVDDVTALAGLRYGDGVPAARGVVCAALRSPESS